MNGDNTAAVCIYNYSSTAVTVEESQSYQKRVRLLQSEAFKKAPLLQSPKKPHVVQQWHSVVEGRDHHALWPQRQGIRAVTLCWEVMEVHYGQGLARNGVLTCSEPAEMTLTRLDVSTGVFLSHSPKIYSMWLDGYSTLQQSMYTIKTTYSWSSKDIPADSKDGAIRSLHSNVSWYLSVLPGCSLQGSFPLPPLTRGLCLAPEGMSSYTHTWSSARWEPCWTACTCTPNLSRICMKTHT